MRIHTTRARALGAFAAAAAALAVAAPAGAATAIPISGTQTVVDEEAGTFKMQGSLVGDWAITSFHVLANKPRLHAKGTERTGGTGGSPAPRVIARAPPPPAHRRRPVPSRPRSGGLLFLVMRYVAGHRPHSAAAPRGCAGSRTPSCPHRATDLDRYAAVPRA